MTNTIELVLPTIDPERITETAYQQSLTSWFEDARGKALEAVAAAQDDRATAMGKAFAHFDLMRLFMRGTDADVRQVLIDVSQAELDRATARLQGLLEQFGRDMAALVEVSQDAQLA